MWNKAKMSGYDFVKKLEACKESAGHRADYWTALAWIHYEQGNVEAIDAIQASEHRVKDEDFLNALEDPEKPVGRLIRSFVGHKDGVNSIAFSRDGKYALSGSGTLVKPMGLIMDNTLRLWEISTGKEVRKFDGHTFIVSSEVFSPDGGYALSASRDKTLRLLEFDWDWEIPNEKE
jgi:WD40 repeat protein